MPSAPTTLPTKAVQGVLVIDHGSPRSEANQLFETLIDRLAVRSGVLVQAAHMEGSAMDIRAGFARLHTAGAMQIVVLPLFFGPGKHLGEDIPALCRQGCGFGQQYRIMDPLLEDRGFENYLLARVCLKLKEA